jgi:CRISPR-associated protein Csb1
MSVLQMLDAYLDHSSGPAALVLREELTSIEGPDGVFFPPTFATGEGFPGGYNIDGPADGENVCLVDTVGAQANRLEPMFGHPPYSDLVPQIQIRVGERLVSLLNAGHRAGDALVRCSALQEELEVAFKALLRGNASPLAKVAPTSLVFGVWDSRGTQAKAPRIVASTIRAYNVRRLTRSAQFVPAVEYVAEGLLDEPADKKTSDAYSARGFIHVPATGSHGGVIAKGGIRRDANVGLAALRSISVVGNPSATRDLQRYILGISLTAFTANTSSYLRQGCNLVQDPTKERRLEEVYPDGTRKPFALSHGATLEYARAAAQAFGVGESRTLDFDRDRAKEDIAGDGEKKKAKKAAKKEKK